MQPSNDEAEKDNETGAKIEESSRAKVETTGVEEETGRKAQEKRDKEEHWRLWELEEHRKPVVHEIRMEREEELRKLDKGNLRRRRNENC